MSVVLITGANRGLGLALTRQFLAKGHTTIATCRDPIRAIALHELLRQTDHLPVRLLPLDVTNPNSVNAAARTLQTLQPTLDILVNNAGIHPEQGDEPFLQIDPEHFRTAFETNLLGVTRVCRAFLPLLLEGSQPRIVNISSGAGSISTKSDCRRYCYSASKAALNMFTRGLAHEYRARGLAVVAISPGWVQTDMGGPNAELTPDESAAPLADTILNLSPAQSGLFLDRFGCPGTYAW